VGGSKEATHGFFYFFKAMGGGYPPWPFLRRRKKVYGCMMGGNKNDHRHEKECHGRSDQPGHPVG
jgi:hypothetical protein